MATSVLKLPDFGADNKLIKPDQPQCEFDKTKIVYKESVSGSVICGKWRWLHYDCSRDLIFYHTCVKTGKLRLLTGNTKDQLFFLLALEEYS